MLGVGCSTVMTLWNNAEVLPTRQGRGLLLLLSLRAVFSNSPLRVSRYRDISHIPCSPQWDSRGFVFPTETFRLCLVAHRSYQHNKTSNPRRSAPPRFPICEPDPSSSYSSSYSSPSSTPSPSPPALPPTSTLRAAIPFVSTTRRWPPSPPFPGV